VAQNQIPARLPGATPQTISDLYDKINYLLSKQSPSSTPTTTPTAPTTPTTSIVADISGASGQASGPQFADIPILATLPSNNPVQGAPYAQNGLMIDVGGQLYIYVAGPTFAWTPAVAEATFQAAETLTVGGTANAITGTTPTTYAALATGYVIRLIPTATNTGAVTININSIGAKAITKNGTAALVGGELVNGNTYFLLYDGTRFQILGEIINEVTLANSEWVTVGGAANAITGITANKYTALANGFLLRLIPTSTNTGATTLNINSIGAHAVTKNGNVALTGGELTSGIVYFLLWDGTEFQIVGSQPVTEAAIANSEWITVGGTANAITGATATPYTSLAPGFLIRIIPTANNTSATTLNVNGIGAQPVTKDGNTALSGGELLSGVAAFLLWDGTEFQIVGAAAGVTQTVATFTPALLIGGSGTGITYSNQTGVSILTGDQVVLLVSLTLSGIPAPSGGALTIDVSGAAVPVSVAPGGIVTICYMTGWQSLTGAPSGLLPTGTGSVHLYQWGATGVSGLTDANITAASVIYLAVVYVT
jgi:hypothetical protein